MELDDFISALAGPAMRWAATRGQAQRQNAINDTATAYKMGQSGRAMDATGNLLASTVAPSAIATNDAAAKATLADNLSRTIAAQKAYEVGPNYGGKVTGDYANRFASNNADIAERIKRSIDQFSTIGAPAVRQQGDAVRFAQAGNTVASANTANKNVGARYDAAINSVRPNPLMLFGSELADGFNQLRAKQRLKPTVMQTSDAYSPGYLGGTSEGE